MEIILQNRQPLQSAFQFIYAYLTPEGAAVSWGFWHPRLWLSDYQKIIVKKRNEWYTEVSHKETAVVSPQLACGAEPFPVLKPMTISFSEWFCQRVHFYMSFLKTAGKVLHSCSHKHLARTAPSRPFHQYSEGVITSDLESQVEIMGGPWKNLYLGFQFWL